MVCNHFLGIHAMVTSGATFPLLSCLQELVVALTHAHFVPTLAAAGVNDHLERVRENTYLLQRLSSATADL